LHRKQIFNVSYFKKRTENKKKFKNVKNVTRIKQEGQHPLTGQRAPPISGGT